MITDIIEWDINNWWRALTNIDTRLPENLNGKSVLCIGERNGGLSLYFLFKGAKYVTCTDKLDYFDNAKNLHQKYGFYNVEYKTLDISKDDVNIKYDIIAFKSVLGAVGYHDNKKAQLRALETIYNSLKPDGYFVFLENLNSSRLHSFLRKAAGQKSYRHIWRYLNYNDIPEFLKSFSDVNVKTYGFIACFGRSENQRRILSKVDQLLEKYIHEKNRYIASVVCRK